MSAPTKVRLARYLSLVGVPFLMVWVVLLQIHADKADTRVATLEHDKTEMRAELKALRSLPWRIEVRPVIREYKGLPGFAGSEERK